MAITRDGDNLYSSMRFVGDGVTKRVPLTFDLNRGDGLAVDFGEGLVTSGYLIDYDVTPVVVLFSEPLPLGKTVTIRRLTKIDKVKHIFQWTGNAQGGADFSAKNVDENFEQITRASQDAMDSQTLASETLEEMAGIRDTAIDARDKAKVSESNAKASETNAKTSETNASNSANRARDSENLAKKWATNPEDVEVAEGKYSAYHWAMKAKDLSGLDFDPTDYRKKDDLLFKGKLQVLDTGDGAGVVLLDRDGNPTGEMVHNSTGLQFVEHSGGTSHTYTLPDEGGELLTSNSKRIKDFPVIDDYSSVEEALASGDYINFLGKTVEVLVKPTKVYGYNGYLRHGKISYPQDNTLKTDVAKITNAQGYTAWAQDKAYTIGDQIKVWLNHGDAHLDGQLVPAYIISEDGGSSWSGMYFPFGMLTGHTCWSAGYDGEYEYVIVRKESDLSNTVYRRKPDAHSDYNELKGWEKLNSVFPKPVEATDPDNFLVMIHSFTVGRGGSIIVGAHYSKQWVGGYESQDKGLTWTPFTLSDSTLQSEPTIKYDNLTDMYYGFIRNGSATGNPQYFSATDLNSPLRYTAPSGTFGAYMSSTPVPLYVENGKVWAFCGFRNGIIEGRADLYASQFMLYADMSQGGNFWNKATIVYLGDAKHKEEGGASALSVGSVVKFGNKLLIFSGAEERTGTSPTPTNNLNVNRIANIQQTAVNLGDSGGIISEVDNFRSNRYSHNGIAKLGSGECLQEIGLPVFRRYKDISQNGLNQLSTNSSFAIFDYGNASGGIACTTSSSYSYFYGNNSTGLRIDNTSNTVHVMGNGSLLYTLRPLNITPASDGGSDLGSSALAFKTVFLKNNPTITSDRRKKDKITSIDPKWFEVLELLDFKQYVFKGEDVLHFGIIAQEWLSACEVVGVDPYACDVLVGSEEEGYAIRYGELQTLFNAYILTKLK